jgi:hypothetical protein
VEPLSTSADDIGDELARFSVAGSEVTVEHISYDGTQNPTSLSLAVDRAELPTDQVNLTLCALDDGQQWVGGRLELARDAETICGVAVTVDITHPHRARVTEFTARDTMIITYEVNDGIVFESYCIRGKTIELQYPDIPYDRRAELADLYQADQNFARDATWLTEDDVLFVDALKEFAASVPADNSLYDNSYGSLMAELATDTEFIEWYRNTLYGDDYDPERPMRITAEKMCGIASLAGATKCWVGGIANFVCVAATGVSIACGIAVLCS